MQQFPSTPPSQTFVGLYVVQFTMWKTYFHGLLLASLGDWQAYLTHNIAYHEQWKAGHSWVKNRGPCSKRERASFLFHARSWTIFWYICSFNFEFFYYFDVCPIPCASTTMMLPQLFTSDACVIIVCEWESHDELGRAIRDLLCGSKGKSVSLPHKTFYFYYVASSYCLLKNVPNILLLCPSEIREFPTILHFFLTFAKNVPWHSLCLLVSLWITILALPPLWDLCTFWHTLFPHCPSYVSHYANIDYSMLYLRFIHVDMCSLFIFTDV